MKLSWQQKELFYHELAQYIRSGISLADALQSMLDSLGPGNLRTFTEQLLSASRIGQSIHSVFIEHRETFTILELTLISSAGESGRLEDGFRHLAAYFKTLHQAKQQILNRLAYPAFVFHFGVLLLNLPLLFTDSGSLPLYAAKTFGLFVGIYIAIGLLYTTLRTWQALALSSSIADAALRKVPLFGPVCKFSALSRFCMALQMQVQAGVDPIQGLPIAAKTSQSGLISTAVERALPKLHHGATLSEALNHPNALEPAIMRALKLGQEAGTLDEEMQRWGNYYLEKQVSKIETLSDWLPKILYFLILGYLAYQIIDLYKGLIENYDKAWDSF